jgi:hypothetical protein
MRPPGCCCSVAEAAVSILLSLCCRDGHTDAAVVSHGIHERKPMDRILVKVGNSLYATTSSH